MHERFFVHPQLCLVVSFVLRVLGGSVSAPGIFFYPCPTGDLLGGALSAMCAQCNYLDV